VSDYPMKTVAFVGPSGTGKSHRAMWVAKENDIECIIDDGLLIKDNRILAGLSAKKESTRLASVRRALFIDPDHVRQVKEAIRAYSPESILVLGTSMGMIEAIVKALDLPPISEIIRIEDVAGPEEIEKAKKMRKTEGKHVIPVPTFEIKKDFSGYFIDSLKVLRRDKKNNRPIVEDKSVVRPTFSYMGKYTISNNVLYTICDYEATRVPNVVKVNRKRVINRDTGIIVNIDLTLKYGSVLKEAARKVQYNVKEAIEKYTALNVLEVNIIIKNLSV